MNPTPFQNTLNDITQLIHAIDEISVEADALACVKALALDTAHAPSPADGLRALEAIADSLDRIIAKAQEVELLVAIVPDPTLTAALQGPSTQLREAVTSLVVCAYGAVESMVEQPSPSLQLHAV